MEQGGKLQLRITISLLHIVVSTQPTNGSGDWRTSSRTTADNHNGVMAVTTIGVTVTQKRNLQLDEYIVRGKCLLTEEEFLYFIDLQCRFGVYPPTQRVVFLS